VNDFVKRQRLIIGSRHDMNCNTSSQPENNVHLRNMEFTNSSDVFLASNINSNVEERLLSYLSVYEAITAKNVQYSYVLTSVTV
jgi:hypothetical protein